VKAVISVPVVGHLVDSNGDGSVDLNDNPMVIAVAFDDSASKGHMLVLDGTTRAEVWSVPNVNPWYGRALADADGWTDVLAIDSFNRPIAFRGDGTTLWSSTITGCGGHWTAVVDYDGDLEAEVIMIGDGQRGMYGPDGTELVRKRVDALGPGAPCVADFDGDGGAEMAWASANVFQMVALDGTRNWSRTIDDSSGLAACSGYDIDGDGMYEILYADQGTFFIFDGATGAIHFSQGGHASGTLWEYPSVADIDNDGSAEIPIGSNNDWMSDWSGITAFGHSGSGWMKSGPTWHSHNVAVTNIPRMARSRRRPLPGGRSTTSTGPAPRSTRPCLSIRTARSAPEPIAVHGAGSVRRPWCGTPCSADSNLRGSTRCLRDRFDLRRCSSRLWPRAETFRRRALQRAPSAA